MPAKYHKGPKGAWGRSPEYTDTDSLEESYDKEYMLRKQMQRIKREKDKKKKKKKGPRSELLALREAHQRYG